MKEKKAEENIVNMYVDFVIDEEKTNPSDIEYYKRTKKYTKIAYIASPYSGDVEKNVENARRYCRWVYENTDFVPIAPHLLFPQFLDDNNTREHFVATMWNEKILDESKILLIFGEEITPGMVEEIEYYKNSHREWRIIYFKENKQIEENSTCKQCLLHDKAKN